MNKLFHSDRLYSIWLAQIPSVCGGPREQPPSPLHIVHNLKWYKFSSKAVKDEYGDVCFAIFTKTCDAVEKDKNGTLTEADLDEIEELMARKEEIEDGLVEC